jgi:hypothetical protein
MTIQPGVLIYSTRGLKIQRHRSRFKRSVFQSLFQYLRKIEECPPAVEREEEQDSKAPDTQSPHMASPDKVSAQLSVNPSEGLPSQVKVRFLETPPLAWSNNPASFISGISQAGLNESLLPSRKLDIPCLSNPRSSKVTHNRDLFSSED